MKKAILVLLLCLIVGFSFVSCNSEPKDQPAPQPPEEKYAGKIYNQTGKVAYNDLPAAIEALEEGDVLVFYKDETLNSSVTITKSVTLDLNGHTIDGSGIDLSNAGAGKTNTASDHGVIELTGVKGTHIASVIIKNGTIKGSVCGANSCGVIRGIYVEDLTLNHVSLINGVPVTGAIYQGLDAQYQTTMRSISPALYNAYCNLTINNGSDDLIQGRMIIYINDTVSTSNGGIVTSCIINGGKFSNDPASDDAAALLPNGKNASALPASHIVVNNAQFVSGGLVVSKAGADADTAIKLGTYSFDPTTYVDGTKYKITPGEGTWTVTAK